MCSMAHNRTQYEQSMFLEFVFPFTLLLVKGKTETFHFISARERITIPNKTCSQQTVGAGKDTALLQSQPRLPAPAFPDSFAIQTAGVVFSY